jgi:hypothetical protein
VSRREACPALSARDHPAPAYPVVNRPLCLGRGDCVLHAQSSIATHVNDGQIQHENAPAANQFQSCLPYARYGALRRSKRWVVVAGRMSS